jgi:hypothetical protein
MLNRLAIWGAAVNSKQSYFRLVNRIPASALTKKVHMVAKTGDTDRSDILLEEEFWLEPREYIWEDKAYYMYWSKDGQAVMDIYVNERSNEVEVGRLSSRSGQRHSHYVYFGRGMEYQKYPPCVLQFYEVVKA